jgi:hypothetical protein
LTLNLVGLISNGTLISSFGQIIRSGKLRIAMDVLTSDVPGNDLRGNSTKFTKADGEAPQSRWGSGSRAHSENRSFSEWEDNTPFDTLEEFFESWGAISMAVERATKNSVNILKNKDLFDNHYQDKWRNMTDEMTRRLLVRFSNLCCFPCILY